MWDNKPRMRTAEADQDLVIADSDTTNDTLSHASLLCAYTDDKEMKYDICSFTIHSRFSSLKLLGGHLACKKHRSNNFQQFTFGDQPDLK